MDEFCNSFCFPSHATNPLCPVLDIIPLQQALHSIVVLSKNFITFTLVDKAMARSTKPRTAIQHPFVVPLAL